MARLTLFIAIMVLLSASASCQGSCVTCSRLKRLDVDGQFHRVSVTIMGGGDVVRCPIGVICSAALIDSGLFDIVREFVIRNNNGASGGVLYPDSAWFEIELKSSLADVKYAVESSDAFRVYASGLLHAVDLSNSSIEEKRCINDLVRGFLK